MSLSTQAVLFDNHKFSTATSMDWLIKHDFKPIKMVHKTVNYYRYRIVEPDKFDSKSFRMKELGHGIKMVIGELK